MSKPSAGALSKLQTPSKPYNGDMARGWESKSVEAQIEENKSTLSKFDAGQSVSREEVLRKSRRANLQLSRKRILQDLEAMIRTERYSEMLRRSLAELDGQLQSHL